MSINTYKNKCISNIKISVRNFNYVFLQHEFIICRFFVAIVEGFRADETQAISESPEDSDNQSVNHSVHQSETVSQSSQSFFHKYIFRNYSSSLTSPAIGMIEEDTLTQLWSIMDAISVLSSI